MLIITRNGSAQKLIRDAVQQAIDETKSSVTTLQRLHTDTTRLREELETLKIEKGRREEEFAKKERETEHKVGLERKRSDFERESAAKEAALKVREENLKADQQRFSDQLKFHETRFTTEIEGLKNILAEVIKRLPSAEFTADLGVIHGRRVR